MHGVREGGSQRGREEEMKGGREGRLCKGESHLLLLRECKIGGGNRGRRGSEGGENGKRVRFGSD